MAVNASSRYRNSFETRLIVANFTLFFNLIMFFILPSMAVAQAQYFDRSALDAAFSDASQLLEKGRASDAAFGVAPPAPVAPQPDVNTKVVCNSELDVQGISARVAELRRDAPKYTEMSRELSVMADDLLQDALFDGLDGSCPANMQRKYATSIRELDEMTPDVKLEGIVEMSVCLRDQSRQWREAAETAEAEGNLIAQARASSVRSAISNVDIEVNGARREFDFFTEKKRNLQETLNTVNDICRFE